MKIYIAGPMTGLPEFNRPAFYGVMREINHAKAVPLNPAILPDGLEQHEYMALCIEMVKMARCAGDAAGVGRQRRRLRRVRPGQEAGQAHPDDAGTVVFSGQGKAGKDEGEAA